MGKPRKPRLTKGDTFTFCRDARTGETLVRCLFCDESYPVQQAWTHVCKPENVKPPPGPAA